MRNLLISEVHITKPRVKISYYMIQDRHGLGVEISMDNDESAACYLPGTPEEIAEFITSLASGAVRPVMLHVFAEDYITEKNSLELLT